MAAIAKSEKKKQGIFSTILDAEKPRIVNKWDGNAIKNSLDDVIRKFFTETLGYEENHSYIDVRLTLSGAGCAIALSALAYDYFFPYPASRYVVLSCVMIYFVLMSVLTLFTAMVEKNYILIAMEKDKAGLDPSNTWKIASSLQRFDYMFNLSLEYQDGKTKERREVDLKESVSKWIDEDGLLLAGVFETELKSLKGSLTGEKKEQ